MRYLILLIFISCNAEEKKEIVSSPVEYKSTLADSVSIALDTLQMGIADLKELSDFAKAAQAKIARLEREKRQTEKEIEVYPMSVNPEYQKDDRDKIIADLRKKVSDYENEIAGLKNQLYREQVKVDKVPNKIEVEKPNEKSLIVSLSGPMENGASVWIMEASRKAKKIMKGYYNCQVKDLNDLGAKEAKRYKDVYFFNDIPEGKYLIKVCALYGDWVEIKRKDERQTVAMKVAPPIQ